MKSRQSKPETPFVVIDMAETNPGAEEFVERFDKRVIGQPGASRIARMVYDMYHNPIRDKRRPIGIFYLVGPSRTGKSLTGEVLAELFHGDVEALTRLQAADYEEDHEKSDIKGAPPSYVGYRDPKDPKNKLQPDEEDPYSVVSQHNLTRVRLNSGEVIDIVVIEEFEKSKYDFYKFWMGVFDKGKAKLRNGTTVDFTNTVFILTSNLGTDDIEKVKEGGIGFVNGGHNPTEKEVTDIVNKAMKRRYKKEFRNRLDAVVIFRPHTADDIKNIVDSEIRLIEDRIVEQMPRGSVFELDVVACAREFLLKKAGNEVAELKRVLGTFVVAPLGRLLHPKYPKVHGGDIVRITFSGDLSKVSTTSTGEVLDFAVARGAATEHNEAEYLFQHGGDTPETMNGLAFQRRVAKARREAERTPDKKEGWSVILKAKSQSALAEAVRELMHDLERVYVIEFDWPSFSRKAPWMFTCTMVATEEQVALVRVKYPDATINKTGKALATRS